jgi:hypothetical protein
MHWLLSYRKRGDDPEWLGPPRPAVSMENLPDLASLHARHEGFRALHVACARREAVRIIYRSNTDVAIPMTVSPHTLVVGYQREHFRCHVDERGSDGSVHRPLLPGNTGQYWADIVPYRVLAIEETLPASYVPQKADIDWSIRESLVFRMARDIPQHIADLLQAEMTGISGYFPPHLILDEVRKPLLRYVARQVMWRMDGNDEPFRIWQRLEGKEAQAVLAERR